MLIPRSSRSQFVWALLLFVAAFAYGHHGDEIFVISFIGENIRFSIPLTIFGVALVWVGVALVPLRQSAPETVRTTTASRSLWPIVGAASVLFFALGFAVNGWYTVLGGVVLAVAAGGALGQAWREDLGWNPYFGERLGERVVRPVGLPLVSIVAIATVALSVSRVLLALSENVAVIIAIVMAAGLLTTFSVLAALQRLKSSVLLALGIFSAIIVVSVGITSAGAGATKEERVGKPLPQVINIYAKNTSFVQAPNTDAKLTSLDIPAQKSVTFVFHNDDLNTIYHNTAIYSVNNNDVQHPFWNGTPVHGGKVAKNTFVTPSPGTYVLRCDFHPSMVVNLKVQDTAAKGSE